MAILFALVALVGWGAGDVFITLSSRKIGNGLTTFWWLVFNLLLSLLYLPFAPPINNWGMVIVAVAMGLVSVISVLLYTRALEIGNASLVGTISGAFAIITVPLSMILFGERLVPVQLMGIILILVGLVMATLKMEAIREIKTGKVFSDPGAGLALIVMIIWGVYWTLIRIPVETLGWFWAGIPTYLYFFLLPLIGVVKKNPIKVLHRQSTLISLIAATLFTISANYAFNIGITYGYSSLVAPVAGAAPVLFVILSRFVFRDRLSRQQKIGIITALAGIILIAISSGN